MNTIRKASVYLSILGLALVTACQVEGPATAIEAYLQAVVSKDPVQAVNLSCAAWEEEAKAEAASFEAVEAKLQDAVCSDQGGLEGSRLVSCQGVILATYGAEDQELPLEGRQYRVVQEASQWRMCGYE